MTATSVAPDRWRKLLLVLAACTTLLCVWTCAEAWLLSLACPDDVIVLQALARGLRVEAVANTLLTGLALLALILLLRGTRIGLTVWSIAVAALVSIEVYHLSLLNEANLLLADGLSAFVVPTFAAVTAAVTALAVIDRRAGA